MANVKKIRTLDTLPLDGKVVLLRVDFNVALNANGEVDSTEDYRIRAALPTIRELQQRRCRIVLMTHLGDEGHPQDVRPVHAHLQELLHEDVRLAKHLFGAEVSTLISALEPGGIVMLPNVRSDERECHASRSLGEKWADLAEVYVNDAFSASHREHTSITIMPQLLPACAGRRTVLEVEVLSRLRRDPRRPYIAIISGAKIGTKVGLLRALASEVDCICLGGQIANVFLVASHSYRNSVYDEAELELARELLKQAPATFVLPQDVVIGSADGHDAQVVTVTDMPQVDTAVWDIGPKTIAAVLEKCRTAATIMWNGPLGRVEVAPYAKATTEVAQALARLPAYRVVGGGDTVTMLEQLKLSNAFDHVSVGGGAMVEFVEKGELPGLTPLYA